MDRTKTSFLGRAALLSRLPRSLLHEVMARTNPVVVRRRRALWRAGDPADHLYFVRSGVVRIGLEVDANHTTTLWFHAKGDVVGEVGALMAVTGAEPVRATDAYAHEELVTYALPIDALRELLRASSEVAVGLAGLAAERRRRVEHRVLRMPFQPVKARVASSLLELAESFGVRDSRGIIVNLRLTHRELAELVGSTRETVSVLLAELRRAGVLEIESKRMVLLDLGALASRAAEPPE